MTDKQLVKKVEGEISTLNDDCMYHVLSYLPVVDRLRLELVCKQWHWLSRGSWTGMTNLEATNEFWGFTSEEFAVDSAKLRYLLEICGQYVRRINVADGRDKLCSATWSIVSELCPNLNALHLSIAHYSNQGIESLTSNCRRLKELVISNGKLTADQSWINFISAQEKLKLITFNRVAFASDKILSQLPMQIEEIRLNKCSVAENFLSNFVPTEYPNLHSLSVYASKFFTFFGLFKSLSISANGCLKKLSITEIFNVPLVYHSYCASLKNFNALEYLNLSGNDLVNDELLQSISKSCSNLLEVDISSCHKMTKEGLYQLLNLPKLKSLKVNYLNYGIIDDEIVSKMTDLKSLQCRGSYYGQFRLVPISERQSDYLQKNASQLQNIDLETQ